MADTNNEILKLWNFGDLPKSRNLFLEKMNSQPKNSDFSLELKTQIARTYGLEANFKKAHTILDEVESLLKTGVHTFAKIRYHLERGRVFNSANDKPQAETHFLESYKLATIKSGTDYLAIDAAHMLAIVSTSFANQKEWTEKALVIAKESLDKNASNWRGSLLNNWGWAQFDQKLFTDALKTFKQAEEFRAERDNKEAHLISIWCVARTLRALGNLDQALAMQLTVLNGWNSIRKSDGYVYEELGEIYLELNNTEQSKKYFRLAFDLLSKDIWLSKNEPDRLQRILQLSK